MKYLKILGLAAIAAAALMAFVGSSTASATVLCKVEPNEGTTNKTKGTTCPPGSAYGEAGKGVLIKAKLVAGTKAKLVTSFKTIECEESTVEGETSTEEASPLTGPEGKLTFSKCNCEVKVLKAGTLTVEWIPDTFNGTVTSHGSESTVTCSTIFGNVHCIYTTVATHVGTLTGGVPAVLDAEEAEIPKEPTNGLCSELSKWTAKYEVTSPTSLYVAGET